MVNGEILSRIEASRDFAGAITRHSLSIVGRMAACFMMQPIFSNRRAFSACRIAAVNEAAAHIICDAPRAAANRPDLWRRADGDIESPTSGRKHRHYRAEVHRQISIGLGYFSYFAAVTSVYNHFPRQ